MAAGWLFVSVSFLMTFFLKETINYLVLAMNLKERGKYTQRI
jgi:hypothetical protein